MTAHGFGTDSLFSRRLCYGKVTRQLNNFSALLQFVFNYLQTHTFPRFRIKHHVGSVETTRVRCVFQSGRFVIRQHYRQRAAKDREHHSRLSLNILDLPVLQAHLTGTHTTVTCCSIIRQAGVSSPADTPGQSMAATRTRTLNRLLRL